MRALILSLCISVSANTILAQQPPDTSRSAAFFQKAMREISYKHTGWVKKSAREFIGQSFPNAGLTRKANEYGKSLSMKTSDIDALVFLVLMEVAQETDREMRAIAAEMKSLNEKKERMRETMTRIEARNGLMKVTELDSFKIYLLKPGTINRRSNPSLPATKEEIDDLKSRFSNDIDAATELYESKLVQNARASVNLKQMLQAISVMLQKLKEMQAAVARDLRG